MSAKIPDFRLYEKHLLRILVEKSFQTLHSRQLMGQARALRRITSNVAVAVVKCGRMNTDDDLYSGFLIAVSSALH